MKLRKFSNKEKSDLVRGGRVVRIKIMEVVPVVVLEAQRLVVHPQCMVRAESCIFGSDAFTGTPGVDSGGSKDYWFIPATLPSHPNIKYLIYLKPNIKQPNPTVKG